MAIKIYEKFAPFANPANGDYPHGSFKNDSIPGAEDGTPLDAVWANDYAGFDAELLAQAGIVPNGQPDKLGASQRLEAMIKMFSNVGAVADRFGYSKDKTALQNGEIINALITMSEVECIVLPFAAPLEGVVISRCVRLVAPTSGQFEVQTDGAFCIKLIKGAVACTVDGISPVLMGVNQTKIIIDGREGTGSAPQLNKFYNINTEAGESGTKCRDGSLSLLLTSTWSNFFYGCTFNRSQNGIQFGVEGEAENQTNANYFIGCELRSVNTYTNGGQAIIQHGGDGNTWLGGIIENWKLNCEIRAGVLIVTGGAYVEAFASEAAFALYGGALKIVGNIMNSQFVLVYGNSSLTYEDNTVSTALSNINFPVVQMRADAICKMTVRGNKPNAGGPDGYFTRNGKWRDAGGTWFNLTYGLKNQQIDDNATFVFAEVSADIPNVTGDGTEYVLAPIAADVVLDEVGEYSAGTTIPRTGGLYSVEGVVTLTGLTFTGVLSIFARSGPGTILSYLASETLSPSDSVAGNRAFSFRGIIHVDAGQALQVRVSVSGGTKTVGVKGKSGGGSAVRSTHLAVRRVR